jgi:DNA-directed RNA polymerase subunit L
LLYAHLRAPVWHSNKNEFLGKVSIFKYKISIKMKSFSLQEIKTEDGNLYDERVWDVCAPTVYTNAIRRTLMSNISSYSFGKLNIRKNISNVNRNELAQIMSMIPVAGEVKASLNIARSAHADPLDVTTRHLTIVEGDKELVYPNMFLFKLLPNQAIDMTFETERGTASEHSRWQVCIPFVRPADTNDVRRLHIERIQFDCEELLINAIKLRILDAEEFLEAFAKGTIIATNPNKQLIEYMTEKGFSLLSVVVYELRQDKNVVVADAHKRHPSEMKIGLYIRAKRPIEKIVAALRRVVANWKMMLQSFNGKK